MKIKLNLLAILFFILAIQVAFAETAIKAEIDKKVITTDETLTYKLIIASTSNTVPQPKIPKFEGFKVISRAQSSTISFVKGGAKTIFVYVFILYPDMKGKLKIGPSQIKIGDTDAASEAFEVEVKQGKRKIEPQPSKKPSLPQNLKSNTEQFTL